MLLLAITSVRAIFSLQSNPRGVRSGEANIVALISGRPGLAQTPIFHSFLELFVVFALIHPPSSVAGRHASSHRRKRLLWEGRRVEVRREGRSGATSDVVLLHRDGWHSVSRKADPCRRQFRLVCRGAVGKVWRHAPARRRRFVRDQRDAGEEVRRPALHHHSD